MLFNIDSSTYVSPAENISKLVCLITPPSPFLLDERVFPSLGILRVAAVLKMRNIRVDFQDLSGWKNFLEIVRDYALSRSTNIFGISATTPQMPAVAEIVKTIRTFKPDAKVILGGPHVTLVNAAYRKECAAGKQGRATVAMRQLCDLVDVLVCGDGEEAVLEALKPDAPRVIDADDIHSSLFLTNDDLNRLPYPARDLIDLSSYRYSIDGAKATSLIAQLGCPFRCSFCGGRSSPFLRKIRTRTSQNIIEEMIFLWKTYGIEGFMFYDDELNVNKQVIELMDLIAKTQKELGISWKLRGFIKSELFTEAQAESMYRAGFRWILVGFESGSPDILKIIEKNATREQNTRCMEIAHIHGLKVKALMSIGHAGETEKSIFATRDWLIETKPDDFDLSIITCYPGTPYYDEAEPGKVENTWVYTHAKTGARLYQTAIDYMMTADYYKGDPGGGYKAYVHTDELSSDDLVRLRGSIEENVRGALGIPFYQSAPGMLYEHSMGQSGYFPSTILRSTDAPRA